MRDRSCSGLKCQMSSLNWEEVEALNLFVQRMASVTSRLLKAGCSCSKNTTVVLKVVAIDLIKTDKIKSVSQEILHTVCCIP